MRANTERAGRYAVRLPGALPVRRQPGGPGRGTERAVSRQEVRAWRICYGVLACLKGLKEQGCNGPVTAALDKLEKHLNQAAHEEEE